MKLYQKNVRKSFLKYECFFLCLWMVYISGIVPLKPLLYKIYKDVFKKTKKKTEAVEILQNGWNYMWRHKLDLL